MQIVGDKINEYCSESGRNYKSKKLINIKKSKKSLNVFFMKILYALHNRGNLIMQVTVQSFLK